MNQRTSPCTIDGCGKRVNSRGLCSMHYERWRLYGTTDTPRPSLIDRLMAKVSKDAETSCWTWTGHRDPKGYGRFCEGGRGNTRLAHRVAYAALVGPIPDGLDLDHLCVNPPCVNPAHLEPVTHEENIRRRDALRR